MTYEYGCQVGLLATTGYNLFYLFGNLSLNKRTKPYNMFYLESALVQTPIVP